MNERRCRSRGGQPKGETWEGAESQKPDKAPYRLLVRSPLPRLPLRRGGSAQQRAPVQKVDACAVERVGGRNVTLGTPAATARRLLAQCRIPLPRDLQAP